MKVALKYEIFKVKSKTSLNAGKQATDVGINLQYMHVKRFEAVVFLHV